MSLLLHLMKTYVYHVHKYIYTFNTHTLHSKQVPRRVKRKINKEEYVASRSFFFPINYSHTYTHRRDKNIREQKEKEDAAKARRKAELEDAEEERRRNERRNKRKTFTRKRLKKVDDQKKKKTNKNKSITSNTTTSTKITNKTIKRPSGKRIKKRSTKDDSDNSSDSDLDFLQVTTTSSTTERSKSIRSRSKKSTTKQEVKSDNDDEDDHILVRSALGEEEKVDVSIILKQAPIQLPVADHAAEWESLSKNDHPEGVNITSYKVLKDYFDDGKLVVMQMPLGLPNLLETTVPNAVESNMPKGYFGDVRFHKSGKVTIKTSEGIVLNVTKGIPDRMAQEALEIDVKKQALTMLPRIAGRLVVHPDYESLVCDDRREDDGDSSSTIDGSSSDMEEDE